MMENLQRQIPLKLHVAINSLPDAKAVQSLLAFHDKYKDHKWDQPYSISIFEAQSEDNVGKPLRVCANIVSMSSPKPVPLPDGRATCLSLSLSDSDGGELECLDILADSLGTKLESYFRRQAFLAFKGTIVSVIQPGRSPKRYYAFYIVDIDENITSNDLIRLKPDPKNKIGKKYKAHLAKPGYLLEKIKSSLVSNLGIKGLKNAKELDKCIDFMIYQSLSHGMHGGNSLKLHSLVIGNPSEGKKLLIEIAKVLNPVCPEVTPEKLTPASLIGSFKRARGGDRSIPGYLPLSSGGVLCIQDFHDVKDKRRSILNIFSEVMEDGKVSDSTSAKIVHDAATSVHLDMNRISHVYQDKEVSAYADINLPLHIISRFDFIMDIPPDPERLWRVTATILEGQKKIKSSRGPINPPQWQRELKVLVAYLRDLFGTIAIPEDTNKYALERLDTLLKHYKADSSSELINQLGTPRGAGSINKYLKAIATANFSPTVKKEHVDKAFEFIEEKVKFLSAFQDAKKPSPAIILNSPAGRQMILKTKFKGMEITRQQALSYLESEHRIVINSKTLAGDLEKIGKKVAHGKWQIS